MPVCIVTLLAIHHVVPVFGDGRRVEMSYNHSHGVITTRFSYVSLTAKPKSRLFLTYLTAM